MAHHLLPQRQCVLRYAYGEAQKVFSILRWNNRCLDKFRSNLQNVPNLRILWHLLLFHLPCVSVFFSPQMRDSQFKFDTFGLFAHMLTIVFTLQYVFCTLFFNWRVICCLFLANIDKCNTF